MKHDEKQFIMKMQQLTAGQRKFIGRFLERAAVDKAFALRAWREREILGALVRSENYIALERWFARRGPELVQSSGKWSARSR